MPAEYEIRVALTLIATADGGRRGPIASSYRPDWVFEGCPVDYTMGQITKLGRDWMHPGETAEVEARIVRRQNIEELDKYIHVGRECYLMEGARRVARGLILEVLSRNLNT